MQKAFFIFIYILIAQSIQAANLCNLQHPETCRAAVIQQLAKLGIIIDEKTGMLDHKVNINDALAHIKENSGIWAHTSDGFSTEIARSDVLFLILNNGQQIDALVNTFLGKQPAGPFSYYSFAAKDENPSTISNGVPAPSTPTGPIDNGHDKMPKTESSNTAKLVIDSSQKNKSIKIIPAGSEKQVSMKEIVLYPKKNTDSQQFNDLHHHERLMHNLTVLQKTLPDNKVLQTLNVSTAQGQHPGKKISKQNINQHFIAYTPGTSDSYNNASRFVDSDDNVWMCSLSGLYNRKINDINNQMLDKIGHSESVQLASSVLHDIPSNHLMTSECIISVKKN